MNETIVAIVTSVISLIAGGGGVFAYLSSRQKAKQTAHDSAVSEWKELYDEMKERLDNQEEENKQLRQEIADLKTTVNNLTTELQNYKKYDTHINELEKYIDRLLNIAKDMLTEEAYKNICAKRPRKNII